MLWAGFDPRNLDSWMRDCGPWAPPLFVGLGVSAMTLMVPKTLVSITAGALFGTWMGSTLMLITAVLAAILNYSIGRWWLLDSIHRRLVFAENQPQPNRPLVWLGAVKEISTEAGFRFHLLVRLMPIPTTLISYTMGATGSRLRPFLSAAAVAVIPQMLWVHGGTAATMIDGPDASRLRWASIIVSVLAAVAISIIVPREAIKRVEAMNRRLPESSSSEPQH